jgi:hypothetical protein
MQTVSAVGGPFPLHLTTQHFREGVLPALATLGAPGGVRIVSTFDS